MPHLGCGRQKERREDSRSLSRHQCRQNTAPRAATAVPTAAVVGVVFFVVATIVVVLLRGGAVERRNEHDDSAGDGSSEDGELSEPRGRFVRSRHRDREGRRVEAAQ